MKRGYKTEMNIQAKYVSKCIYLDETLLCFYGISKGTVVKCLKKGHRLKYLGHLKIKQSDLRVFEEINAYIAGC